MKDINELLNIESSTWSTILKLVGLKVNNVEVLPQNIANSKRELVLSQHTIDSTLGSIVYETGGILVLNGLLRILGSGHEKLPRGLGTWNEGLTFEYGGTAANASCLLVADDALGGFFAINGGKFGSDIGTIYYLPPEVNSWKSLNISYSQLITFSLVGNVNLFYEVFLWENWEDEVSRLDGDKAFSFSPPLWSQDEFEYESSQRHPINVRELFAYRIHLTEELSK